MAESITAIDILMEPDATMVQRAEAVNARLRGVFPKGILWTRHTVRILQPCSDLSARYTSISCAKQPEKSSQARTRRLGC